MFFVLGDGRSQRKRAVYKRPVEPNTFQPNQQSQTFQQPTLPGEPQLNLVAPTPALPALPSDPPRIVDPAEATPGKNTSTVPARGTVKFADGQPLPGGFVMFRSLDRSPPVTARGEISPDGTFQLSTFSPGDGAVIGRHEVLVSPPPFLGDRDAVRVVPQIIDPKFTDYSTSNLRFTVSSNSADSHFEITVQRPPR